MEAVSRNVVFCIKCMFRCKRWMSEIPLVGAIWKHHKKIKQKRNLQLTKTFSSVNYENEDI